MTQSQSLDVLQQSCRLIQHKSSRYSGLCVTFGTIKSSLWQSEHNTCHAMIVKKQVWSITQLLNHSHSNHVMISNRFPRYVNRLFKLSALIALLWLLYNVSYQPPLSIADETKPISAPEPQIRKHGTGDIILTKAAVAAVKEGDEAWKSENDNTLISLTKCVRAGACHINKTKCKCIYILTCPLMSWRTEKSIHGIKLFSYSLITLELPSLVSIVERISGEFN